jgi:hypothetical protein
MKRLIVIKYPPDFDGELHITVESTKSYSGSTDYAYSFARSGRTEGEEWEMLGKTARDIIAQNDRKSLYLK